MTTPTVIDMSRFTIGVQEIARASGRSLPEVVDNEAAAILESVIKSTPALNVSRARSNFENRQFGAHKTGIEPKRPFRGKLTKNGFKTYYYGNRYPDPVWNEISRQRKEKLAIVLSARGLSKKSWLALAQSLGLDVDAPTYVKKAVSKSGPHPEDTQAERVNAPGEYRLRFSNSQPTVILTGGERRLARAIEGRLKFFRKNLELGVFSDIKQVAHAYPGLKIAA